MSIFISWAGDDREVKNVILEKLREKDLCGQKINVYDSDEF